MIKVCFCSINLCDQLRNLRRKLRNTYITSSRLQNIVYGAVYSMACEKALVILFVSLCSSWYPQSEASDGEGSVGCVHMPCPQLLAGGLRVS